MERRFLSSCKIYISLGFWLGALAFGGGSTYITGQEEAYSRAAGFAAAAPADSIHQPSSSADSSDIVQHDFNHREQVIVGGVIMACLALTLAIMNNYNPR